MKTRKAWVICVAHIIFLLTCLKALGSWVSGYKWNSLNHHQLLWDVTFSVNRLHPLIVIKRGISWWTAQRQLKGLVWSHKIKAGFLVQVPRRDHSPQTGTMLFRAAKERLWLPTVQRKEELGTFCLPQSPFSYTLHLWCLTQRNLGELAWWIWISGSDAFCVQDFAKVLSLPVLQCELDPSISFKNHGSTFPCCPSIIWDFRKYIGKMPTTFLLLRIS